MHDPALAEKTSWIALNLAQFTWPALAKDLARHLASPDFRHALLQDGFNAVQTTVPGIDSKIDAIQQSQMFADELARIQSLSVTPVSFIEPDYPPLLRWIAEPPLVLYVRGTLSLTHQLAVAVVGSRQPSPYGKLMAQRFSAGLAQHGYTVISGLARGIDSQAHDSALQAGGQTLAILGSGINVVYPPENRQLADRICKQGAMLSEFPLDTKPDRWNFPRRNRIISGLALGTLVVEATVKSGSLHTARHALEQGREVFAIPGRIDAPNSHGTNRLIQQGAKLVATLDDIVEEFPDAVRQAAQPHQAVPEHPATSQAMTDLSPQEAQIVTLLSSEEQHIDAMIQASQLPAHVVASILVTLELRGLARQLPGKLFTGVSE